MTEEKFLNNVPVTYGAVVSISLPNDENLVVFSEGMIKTQVYLEDLNSNGKEASFYRSLFQIFPSFINTYKKKALALKQDMENNTIDAIKQKDNLEELKEKLTLEYKFNLEYFEKMRGTPIVYDQSIQFLHLASNKFLSCHFKEAEVEKENFKLELVDIPSEATNFKISPSYKHQKESEGYIYFEDSMFIVHASYFLNKVPYFQCNYQEENVATTFIRDIYSFETHNHNFGAEKIILKKQTTVNDPRSPVTANKSHLKKEINISVESSTRWRLTLFSSKGTENEDYLCYGNTIWMNHVEFNASMIAKKQNDLLTIDFARTIISDQFQQYIGNTNGMWIIENENHLIGGPLQWEDKFRLKHFSSGRYLTVHHSLHDESCELTLEHEKSKDSLFQFVMVSSNENQMRYKMINKEAFTRIKSFSTNYWVSVELVEDRLEAVLSKKPLDDDIFKLFKSNNSEIWETSFIISCYPILKDYFSFLESLNQHDTSNAKKIGNKAKEAQECLTQLDLFCTNRLLNTSPDQKYGEINPFRQKVLREQYFLEVLTDILRVIFSPNECEKFLDTKAHEAKPALGKKLGFKNMAKKLVALPKNVNDQLFIEEKIKICKSIYNLIKNICRANPENELYAFNLIHGFQYHAKYFKEAVDCFISIIGPNQTILNKISDETDIENVEKDINPQDFEPQSKKKQIEIFNLKVIFDNKKNDKQDRKSQNFIRYFLSLLRASQSLETNINYLKFLRSICTCNGHGITANQELLFKIFANYKDIDQSVFMEAKVVEDELEIQIDKKNVVSLNSCFKNNIVNPQYIPQITYFKEQLGFYSDLLLDRNYLWKMRLEKQFPLKFVFQQIYNSSISLEIRSIFCELAFTLYIDHEPLNSKVVPDLCRVFKSKHLNNQPSLLTTTEKLQNLDQENLSTLLEHLMEIIRNQKEKISERLKGPPRFAIEDHIKQIQGENLLDNALLANVIRLISKMTRFDLLTILKKNHYYSQLVHQLLHILEFERNNPSFSYVLAATREEKRDKNQKKGNVMNVLGDFVGDLSKGVVGTMKNFADNVFGNSQKKKLKNSQAFAGEAEDALLYSNPLMKGLVDMKLQLDQLVLENERRENTNEIIIKEEICNLFSFMIDLRQDFLLSNILSWYDALVHRILQTSGYNGKMQFVEEGLPKVLPKIPKTGIPEVDEKYREQKLENEMLKNVKGILKINKKKQQQLESTEEVKFVKYTEEAEIPDLDTLFVGDKPQEESEATKAILPSLLISFYLCNDTTLQNKLLTVIMRMFNQKQELAHNIKNVEIIFQKKNIAAYYKLEAWITKLRLQTETSEIWLDGFITTNGEKNQGVINVCELLTNIKDLFKGLDPKTSKHFQSRQAMIRNLSGYTPVIELVRDGMSHLKKAKAMSSFPETSKRLLFKMFQLAHSCLVCFCIHNEINQEILSKQFKLFLSNLDLELGQIPLICEICRDNKHICEIYADTVINSLVNAIMDHGHRTAFLEPLLVLQIQNGIFFVDNQIKILDQFLPSDTSYNQRELNLLYAFEQFGQVQLQFKKIKELDEPFLYHAFLFNILILHEKNSEQLTFVHARLRKIFNIPYSYSILLQPDTLNDSIKKPEPVAIINSDRSNDIKFEKSPSNLREVEEGFSIIKPKILQLLEILYLKSDKQIAQELLEYVDLLIEFINIEQKRLKVLDDDSKPSPRLKNYIFGCLLPFLNSYVNKLIHEASDEIRERRGNNAISSLVHVLYEKAFMLSEGVSIQQLNVAQELFSHYLDEGTKSKIFEEDHPSRNFVPQQNSLNPHLIDIQMKEKSEDSAEEHTNFEKYEELWNEFASEFFASNKIENEIKNEKLALSEAIWNFKDMISEEHKTTFNIELEAKDLVKKLIMFLQYGIAHKADKATMISTLRVLRTLIDNAPDKTEMQNFFDRNDATTMLLSVFSDSKNGIKDDDLLIEFLSFWISLLEGGNKTVQKTIYSFCTLYQKSEVMFAKFHSIIYEMIEHHQVKNSMKNEPNNSLLYFERSNIKSTILEKLLRLLQLFTEGHNLDLQNYLRFQTNSRNRFNIVEAVIELLRIYYLDLVQENYDNIVRCLDTLNEFVQGPCPENQIALIDGKFFEVAVGLLSKKIPKPKQKLEEGKLTLFTSVASLAASRVNTQGRPIERWMLARLKYKVLILINSLLEMRSSDSVVRRIMRSMPLEILKTNLVEVFRRYKKKYGLTSNMNAFKHFDGDPRDRDNKHPKEHYELIIETGFLIYFLISSYLEANVQDVDLQNEIQEMQEGMNKDDKMLEDLLKNNVVGQLGKFGYTFLKSGFDSLSVLKKRIDKTLKGKEQIIPKEEEKRIRKAVEYRQLAKTAMDFFSKNSAHIEVMRNRNIEKVYFILLPYCQELPKETKNSFNENVNRQSPQTKVSDLVESADQIIEICRHELRLKLFFGRNKIIAVFANFVNLWKDLAFFMSLLLNLFILSSFSVRNKLGETDVDVRLAYPILFLDQSISEDTTFNVIQTCGIIMAFSSVFVVIFFLLKRAPLVFKEAWEDNNSANIDNKKKTLTSRLFSMIKKMIKTAYLMLQSVEIVYYLAYGALAIIGTAIHPFFFAFHLTEILIRYPTLKNVIKAVWQPRRQLGLTFLLYLILNYIFSLIGFEFFSQDYGGDCQTTWLCFLNTYDFTFKSNGGIGGHLDEVTPPGDGNYRAGRFFFDFFFNQILVIIMINIVAGIIIDTFGLLREKEEEKNQDIQEKCFICGLAKEVFDRQADIGYDFNIHIKKDHYMWNYLFFIAYLKDKEETEYTGIESYIHERLQNSDFTSWFPFHKALSLKNYEADEEDEQKEIVNSFQNEVEKIKKGIKELTSAYSELTTKLSTA